MSQKITAAGHSRRALLAAAPVGLGGLVAVSARGLAATSPASIRQPRDAGAGAFIGRAFEMRDMAVETGDQPYGAVIVNPRGQIVGQAPSRVVVRGDPTAHAEMEAIRDAAARSGTRDLSGHVIYSSSRPCPMCEAAAYWAGLSDMVHGTGGQSAGHPRLCR